MTEYELIGLCVGFTLLVVIVDAVHRILMKFK